jgi:UDP-N-acetylmuramoyl-L-alanyl-D-glutamate--2,6-diaminopimelate ligase
MAEAAARWSDRIVVTNDNPRTEDPMRILGDVEQGLANLRQIDPESLDAAVDAYAMIPDRRQAIEIAIAIAKADDMVVIAGKGHEDYQIIGLDRLPFVDRDEARRALQNWKVR